MGTESGKLTLANTKQQTRGQPWAAFSSVFDCDKGAIAGTPVYGHVCGNSNTFRTANYRCAIPRIGQRTRASSTLGSSKAGWVIMRIPYSSCFSTNQTHLPFIITAYYRISIIFVNFQSPLPRSQGVIRRLNCVEASRYAPC